MTLNWYRLADGLIDAGHSVHPRQHRGNRARTDPPEIMLAHILARQSTAQGEFDRRSSDHCFVAIVLDAGHGSGFRRLNEIFEIMQ